MPDDQTNPPHTPPKVDRIRLATGHSDAAKDKDYPSRKEARHQAKSDWQVLEQSIKNMANELNVATWDTHHAHKNLISIDAEKHPLITASAFGSGGGIVTAVALGTNPVGLAAGSAAFVFSSLFGGLAQSHNADAKRDIRRDYNGKQESDFMLNLGDGTILHIPVSHQNTLVLAEAIDKARETVNPAAHATREANAVVAEAKSAMVAYLKEHAEGWKTVPIPEKTKTPISGGVDVKGDQVPSVGGTTESKGIPR